MHAVPICSTVHYTKTAALQGDHVDSNGKNTCMTAHSQIAVVFAAILGYKWESCACVSSVLQLS
jgi:hypothetical protein